MLLFCFGVVWFRPRETFFLLLSAERMCVRARAFFRVANRRPTVCIQKRTDGGASHNTMHSGVAGVQPNVFTPQRYSSGTIVVGLVGSCFGTGRMYAVGCIAGSLISPADADAALGSYTATKPVDI